MEIKTAMFLICSQLIFYEKLVKVIGADKVTLEILQGYEHADDRMFEEANVKKVFDFLDSINGSVD